MNNNAEGPWSLGLIRSYSEHAAVLLQHFQQHHYYPDTVKCTRSNSGLYNDDKTLTHSKQDVKEEKNNFSYPSWKLSSSLSEDENQDYNLCRKFTEVGCGDSSALTSEFSELSLRERQALGDIDGCEGAIGLESISLPSTIQNTRTTSSANTENGLSNYDNDGYNNGSDYQLLNPSKSGQDECPNSTVEQEYSSSSSLGMISSRQRLNGTVPSRNISYENWMRDKQREFQRRRDEARRAEIKRCEEAEHEKHEQKAKQLQEYECFLDWMKRKKHEKLLRRKLMEKELELKRHLQDVEQKAQLAKNIGLMQWRKKKEQQQKASEKEELMKQKKAEEEKKRRFQESLKAYEKWREKSKNTPRPATQGLLPYQKAKPTFTNPTPWKSLLDNVSDDSDTTTQSKPPSKTVKNQRSKRTCVKR